MLSETTGCGVGVCGAPAFEVANNATTQQHARMRVIAAALAFAASWRLELRISVSEGRLLTFAPRASMPRPHQAWSGLRPARERARLPFVCDRHASRLPFHQEEFLLFPDYGAFPPGPRAQPLRSPCCAWLPRCLAVLQVLRRKLLSLFRSHGSVPPHCRGRSDQLGSLSFGSFLPQRENRTHGK